MFFQRFNLLYSNSLKKRLILLTKMLQFFLLCYLFIGSILDISKDLVLLNSSSRFFGDCVDISGVVLVKEY